QTLGRALTIPDPWNGRRDGARKIMAQRLGLIWRRLWIAHRDARGIRSVLGTLSLGRSRQTVGLENGAGVFPVHVRDDCPLRRLRRVFCGADHERIAAAASSTF